MCVFSNSKCVTYSGSPSNAPRYVFPDSLVSGLFKFASTFFLDSISSDKILFFLNFKIPSAFFISSIVNPPSTSISKEIILRFFLSLTLTINSESENLLRFSSVSNFAMYLILNKYAKVVKNCL